MIEHQQILSSLYDGLASLTEERFEIDENTKLVGHLNLDSVQIMELIVIIEDRFDISIPLNVLPDVKTVKDLAVQIEKLTHDES